MSTLRPAFQSCATVMLAYGILNRTKIRYQRGVAAIEFAFVVTLFLVLAVAIIGFSTALWGQQVLTSAASEGARAVLDASQSGDTTTTAACTAASAQSSWLTPQCQVSTAACAWSNSDGSVPNCVTVSLNYNLDDWPLMALMNRAAAAFHDLGGPLFPTALAASAVVQIQ